MTLTTWLTFIVACLLISISPGPGAAAALSTGLRHGYRSALSVIAGMQLALFIQLAIVFAGLGALLAASEESFLVIKLLGAAYLVWLGVQKWRAPVSAVEADQRPAGRGLFLQGLLVNLSNPKAIVFAAALVPQFIDPAGSALLQFAIICTTMISIDLVIMSGYALLGAPLRPWLSSPRLRTAQNRFFGGVFIVAGGLLAVSARRG